MKPRHDPVPDVAFGFLDFIAVAMIVIALWSIVGFAAGWLLHHPPTMWRSAWSLAISGAVLLAIGYYEGRSR
jgi:uncharacterized membrane-anchored protein